jgi:hypothetical protein
MHEVLHESFKTNQIPTSINIILHSIQDGSTALKRFTTNTYYKPSPFSQNVMQKSL